MSKNSNWFLQFFNDEEDDYTYKKDISSKPCDIPRVFVNMVYLVNSSNGVVSDDQCNRIVEALNTQLATFCDDWSIKPVIVARSVSPPSGSYQLILTSDSQFTTPGRANGYQMPPAADGTIKAYICVNVIIPVVTTPLPTGTTPSPNGILYPTGTDGISVSRVASHELLEMLVKQGLNKLYLVNLSTLLIRPRLINGTEISGEFPFIAEVSDAVNRQSYTIITSDSTKVQVCDYVMPSWFSVVGKPPFNYNNTLQGPLTVSPEGYYAKVAPDGPYTIKYR